MHSPFPASETHGCSWFCATKQLKREDTSAGKTLYTSVRSRLNNFKDLANLALFFFSWWKFSSWTSQTSYCEVKEKIVLRCSYKNKSSQNSAMIGFVQHKNSPEKCDWHKEYITYSGGKSQHLKTAYRPWISLVKTKSIFPPWNYYL